MTKKTPLNEWHKSHGAKMLEFAGYEMPISYQGVVAEHLAVRNHCGLFDVSHMGEIFLSGKHAEENLQVLTCNDVSKLENGQCQYSILLNERGYPVDDIIVYKIDKENFFLCVNAANVKKDFDWISKHLQKKVQLENQSDAMGMIALQGPKSLELLKSTGEPFPNLKRFHWAECTLNSIPVKLSKTGYTGELGFEFYVPSSQTLALWEWLMQTGKNFGLVPVGLGARDTLRLEMGYALYGHELSSTIDPIAAGLEWVIAWNKKYFIGKEALLEHKAATYLRGVTGMIMEEPGIPREAMELYIDHKVIGKVLSGTQSPVLKKGIASVIVEKEFIKNLTVDVFVDIRGKMKKASLHNFPLISKS